jgi:hypothetical protein
MSNKKPNHTLDKLGGPDIHIESKSHGFDQWATATLAEVGKAIGPKDMQYMTSYAVHLYAPHDLSMNKNQIAWAIQLPDTGVVSEAYVSNSAYDLNMKLKRHFGRTTATRDPRIKALDVDTGGCPVRDDSIKV